MINVSTIGNRENGNMPSPTMPSLWDGQGIASLSSMTTKDRAVERPTSGTGFNAFGAEVTMEHVGLILGIEMSRIARNNKDWHNLLEMCAIFGTILSDEDGVYNPQDTNDRLLLGLKGNHQRI